MSRRESSRCPSPSATSPPSLESKRPSLGMGQVPTGCAGAPGGRAEPRLRAPRSPAPAGGLPAPGTRGGCAQALAPHAATAASQGHHSRSTPAPWPCQHLPLQRRFRVALGFFWFWFSLGFALRFGCCSLFYFRISHLKFWGCVCGAVSKWVGFVCFFLFFFFSGSARFGGLQQPSADLWHSVFSQIRKCLVEEAPLEHPQHMQREE